MSSKAQVCHPICMRKFERYALLMTSWEGMACSRCKRLPVWQPSPEHILRWHWGVLIRLMSRRKRSNWISKSQGSNWRVCPHRKKREFACASDLNVSCTVAHAHCTKHKTNKCIFNYIQTLLNHCWSCWTLRIALMIPGKRCADCRNTFSTRRSLQVQR